MERKAKLYVLKHPISNEIRYVGITIRKLQERLSGHMSDVKNRPKLNAHKTNWIKKIMRGGNIPKIELIKEYENIEDAKAAEIEYIAKYKNLYNLVNATIGGDHLGERSHTRESILKKKSTRSVKQYNIFGEFLRSFDITEDAARYLDLPSASKITACCRGDRKQAHGYIWRYSEDELGDISDLNIYSLTFNSLVQYSLDGDFIKTYDSYLEASKEVGDKSKGGNIASACKGDQRQCKGFLWRMEPKFEYINEEYLDIYVEKNVKIRDRVPAKGVPVNKYDLNNKLIKSYISISEASRDSYGNTNRNNQIREHCKGKNNHQYDNYIWKYCPVEE